LRWGFSSLTSRRRKKQKEVHIRSWSIFSWADAPPTPNIRFLDDCSGVHSLLVFVFIHKYAKQRTEIGLKMVEIQLSYSQVDVRGGGDDERGRGRRYLVGRCKK
jgi:hypothetical protein